jgi:hypothetical protein
MDLGGSGVIHVLAGACALCAVAFIRRTDTGTEDAPACDTEGAPCCSSEIKKCGPKKSESGDLPNAALMQVLESGYHSRVELSTLTLWLGWFGLTVGGVYAQTGANLTLLSRAIECSALSRGGSKTRFRRVANGALGGVSQATRRRRHGRRCTPSWRAPLAASSRCWRVYLRSTSTNARWTQEGAPNPNLQPSPCVRAYGHHHLVKLVG